MSTRKKKRGDILLFLKGPKVNKSKTRRYIRIAAIAVSLIIAIMVLNWLARFVHRMYKVIRVTYPVVQVMDYIPHLEIYDITTNTYQPSLSDPCTVVDFKVKNNGNRTLKQISVAITFKGPYGHIILSEEVDIINTDASAASSSLFNPGSIWQSDDVPAFTAYNIPD